MSLRSIPDIPASIKVTWNSFSRKKLLKYLALVIVYVLLIYLIWRVIPESNYVDWTHGFRPATFDLLSGKSPYEGHGVYNPPWAFLPLIPLVLLPNRVGALLLTLIGFLSFFYIVRRFGANLLIASMFLLTPQVSFKLITNPNIDFLAAFGFLLPPQIGLFFIAIKPQVGIAVAFYWLIESWIKGGVKEIIRVFAPVTLATLLSIVIYGPYFLNARYLMESEQVWWKYPLWPYTIPIGLTLFIFALRQHKPDLSIAASPFLSPYVASYSYPVALIGLISNSQLFYPACIGMWITYLILRLKISF